MISPFQMRTASCVPCGRYVYVAFYFRAAQPRSTAAAATVDESADQSEESADPSISEPNAPQLG